MSLAELAFQNEAPANGKVLTMPTALSKAMSLTHERKTKNLRDILAYQGGTTLLASQPKVCVLWQLLDDTFTQQKPASLGE